MKNLKKIIALGLAGALTVTSLFACGKSPKEKVEEAFKSLGTSTAANALSDELGIAGVMEKIQEKSFEAGIKLALEDTDLLELAMLVSGSIEASIAADVDKENKVLMGLGVGYAASDLLSAQIYVDEEQLALALPGLLDKVPYLDVSGNFAKKLEKSILMKQEGMEEVDLESLADMWTENMANKKDDELAKFVLAFEEETEAIEDFKDAIEVTELDKKEFEINGKEQKCEGFEIVVPEEAFIELTEKAMDYYFSKDAKKAYEKYIDQYAEGNAAIDAEDMKAELDTYFSEISENGEEVLKRVEEFISDIEAEMYIYEGSIVSLEAEVEITDGVEAFEVGIEFECEGGDYGMYDNYELDIKAMSMSVISITKETSNDKDEYEAEWTLGGMAMQGVNASAGFTLDKKDGDFEFEAVMKSSYTDVSCKAEGTLEVDKKKAVTFELDSVEVVVDGDLICELSGECYIKADAKVSMPKGDKFDILTSKQSEWDEFMEDINDLQSSFFDIMNKLY